MATQGKVFFLTGINGAGKDTHAPLLASRISAVGVLPGNFVYAPTISPASAGFRRAVLEGEPESPFAELLGYMAQHAESASVIAKMRSELPQHLVINRGPETCLAYNGYGHFGPNDWQLGIASDIFRNLREEYYRFSRFIFLDVDIPTSRARSAKQAESDYIQERGDEYFRRLIKGYREMARFAEWWTIDASGTIQEVQELIWAQVEPYLQEDVK